MGIAALDFIGAHYEAERAGHRPEFRHWPKIGARTGL